MYITFKFHEINLSMWYIYWTLHIYEFVLNKSTDIEIFSFFYANEVQAELDKITKNYNDISDGIYYVLYNCMERLYLRWRWWRRFISSQ